MYRSSRYLRGRKTDNSCFASPSSAAFDGFTLIELLVTVGIIVLLTAAAIPSFNKYGGSNELVQIANSVKSAILATKNYAMSPTKDKKSRSGVYYISINNSPPGYAIYEEQNSGFVPIENTSLAQNNYSFIFPESAPSAVFYFSVPSGMISYMYPYYYYSFNPEAEFTLESKKTAGKNKINIKVNAVTGQVTVGQPYD